MSCKQVSLSIGALLGHLDGVCLPELMTEKKKYIWVPFLYPEDIKFWILGTILKTSKGTGLSWVDVTLWGTKCLPVRPRCIGSIRAQIHCQSVNQSINESFMSSLYTVLIVHCNTFFMTTYIYKVIGLFNMIQFSNFYSITTSKCESK